MRRGSAAAAILMVASAACKPSAHGRCVQDADCPTGSSCSAANVCIAIAPSVALSVETPRDSGGWFSLSGADLRIVAQVTRGGTDPVSAELTVAACSAPSCAFAGVPAPGGFSFDVPRQVQAAGSADPLPFEVAVTDRAGNRGVAGGVLHIDGAPPAIGTFRVVSPAGIAGEDGQTWYAGSGPPTNTIEIAVPVKDVGAGLASVALSVNADDVKSGTPLEPAPAAGADGTVRFQLPAWAVKKQLPLRFAITATDVIGHVSTADGSVPVDGLAPVVGTPAVDYAAATPVDACASGVECGRQGGTRLLRDDTAEVTFDVTDCGAGVAGPQALTVGGRALAATEALPSTPSACANGNRTHHFRATVDFGTAAISAPDAAAGTAAVDLSAQAADLAANGASAAGTGTVSLWRWKRQLPGAATGAPVLLAGTAGARALAIGSASDVRALGPDGALLWFANVAAGVGTDLALGPGGTLYAVSPRSSCASGCQGTLSLVAPGGTVVTACNAPDVSFGVPPAITTANGAEAAVVVGSAHAIKALANVFVYTNGCTSPGTSKFTPSGADPTGVSAAAGRVFVSHPAGFTTLDQNGNSFDLATASFNKQVGVAAAPAVLGPTAAVFGTEPTDQSVYRAVLNPSCGAQPCWVEATGFTAPQAAANLPFTPLYDGATLYTGDAQGNVFAWAQQSGAPVWSQSTGAVESAPSLLHDRSLLLVQNDGTAALISQAAVTPLLRMAPFGGGAVPVSPAIDSRGTFGVAYVSDGAGWVYALQLPSAPEPASATAWTRPGRDSCNSRTYGSVCP